ncbi:MAG: hypothetical protein CL969_01345, partial [Euryarchaeota archaeon]|nr:hypothetical protein [Euryarchaeota archaeon]
HACCDQKHPGHLTLYEFARAMKILAPELKHFHIRNLFHEIDLNQDGVIDVDEFLESLENGKLEQEE